MQPRAVWPLLQALQVQQLAPDRVVLACATVQQHAQIMATLHGCIGSALANLGAPPTFIVRVGAASHPPDRPAVSSERVGLPGGVR